MKVLLSIKPEFVSKIFNGTKKFEYRKNLFKRKDISIIVVYASSPVKKIVGEFVIKTILTGEVDYVWEQTRECSGISKSYYMQYFENRKMANAIQIGEIKRYKVPKELAEYNILRPPQSFCYINI